MRQVMVMALAMSCFAGPAMAESSLTGVASVIDGDTIDIAGTRVRLWGIDAPESSQTCDRGGTPERCGQKSALALSDLIGRRTVDCQIKDTDRYGRQVASCTVGGFSINEAQVRQGWAVDYGQYSKGAFAAAQSAAQAERAGIWGTRFEMPADYRRSKRG